MSEEKITEPLEFENNGITYIYDYNRLCIEAAELAREAGEFRNNMLAAHPDKFDDVLKSKGAEWLSMIARYLLLESKDGNVSDFNKDHAESITDKFVKLLPLKERTKLMEAVNDFFTNIGMTGISLVANINNQNSDLMRTLLPIMLETLTKQSKEV